MASTHNTDDRVRVSAENNKRNNNKSSKQSSFADFIDRNKPKSSSKPSFFDEKKPEGIPSDAKDADLSAPKTPPNYNINTTDEEVDSSLQGIDLSSQTRLKSPVVGTVFTDREEFDYVASQDELDETTTDVASGINDGSLFYFENPESNEVIVLNEGDYIPDGFLGTGEQS